ncbi:MAG: DUF1566 domain-containing protein [Desulfamplus sp.]|nr:DUF1566 domain-containing protein [Desulfamplus sp.]
MSQINRYFKFFILSIFTCLAISAYLPTPASALMDPHIQSPVPDTGQTTKYFADFGEDADYRFNTMSFTKLDASGNQLPDSATDWAMVIDNVTGLIWEVKKSSDGIPNYDNIHDADNTYTWYDINPDTNGGVAGTPGDKTDTLDFINAMNDEKLGGFADWRMPTKEELNSILNFENHNPAVNTLYFANTIPSYYWTANTLASLPENAWKVDFYAGGDFDHSKLDAAGKYSVRAVRGGQSRLSGSSINNSNFIVNPNLNVITDTNTGLMWQAISSESVMTWEAAINYAENLVLADLSDWRLPTIKELASITAMDRFSPAINTSIFDSKEYEYWSSTTYALSTGNGWVLDFVTYGQAGNGAKNQTGYVRSVRQSGVIPLSTAIEFVSNSFTVGEADGNATITLRRVGDTTNAVSVECITYGGTAIKSLDYNINSTTISWTSGDSSEKTFIIPIINDTTDEANETVHLYLINPTNGASIGAPASAVLSITDDDNVIVQEPTVTTGTASAITATTAKLNGTYDTHKTPQDLTNVSAIYFEYGTTINYGSSTNTANLMAGDIIGLSADLTGLIPNTTYHFRLVVTDNSVTRYGNDIIFTTSGAAGSLQFFISTYQANESDGKITVTVSRTDGSYGAVSVDYALNSSLSTATEGTDFNGASAQLVWQDGDSSDKTFDIAIVDDTIVESTEKIIVELINHTGGATIGSNSLATITIVDNDSSTGGGGGSVTPPSDDGGTVTPPNSGGETTNPPTQNTIDEITDIVDMADSITEIKNESSASEAIKPLENAVSFIEKNIPTDEPPSNEFVEAINTTTSNIGNLLDTSLELLQDGKIGVDQALKPLELLDGIIDIGANAAKSGGAISIEKVAQSIGSVENIINIAISQNATSDQMKTSSGNINNMLGNMADIMNAVLITDDVVKILGPIKGLTGAGITSSLKGNSDPATTLDALGSIVVKGLQEASDAGLVINTGRIIASAGNVVNYSVDVLKTGTNEQMVVQNTLDQLQVELSEMVGQTASNIKDKPVSNSFAASSSGNFSLNDFRYVMDNVSNLTTSMVRAKSILNPNLSGTMQGLSRETLKNILPAFISANRFAAITGDSDIQTLLTEYPQLLNEVIQIASVNLTSGMLITKDDISEIIKNNQSLTQSEKTRLINGLPELPAFDQDIIKSGSTALSLIELLSKELEEELPGTTIEVGSTNGLYLMVMLKNSSMGLEMPLYIQDARVVSSLIPQGLHLLPEGPVILVRNGIAGIITPAPLDAADALLSADGLLKIQKLFGSNGKEISDAKISNSGNLNLKFSDGTKFSGAFAYGVATKGDGGFDAGTSTFELHGTDPASAAYSVLEVYSDGRTQEIYPSISALEQLVQVLDKLAAGSYSLDNSGILTVLGIKFKPSYFIESISTSEKGWFLANRDTTYGIAWELSDYNSDGVDDLKMWTDDGKQVIYTVVQ